MALSSHSLNQKTLEKAILIERSFILSSCKQYACTGDQRIIDVSVGYPSSMNDKRVFKCSSLGRGRLERLLHGTNYYLLGDGGYTLI
jgi:hypothetical protein